MTIDQYGSISYTTTINAISNFPSEQIIREKGAELISDLDI